MRTSTLGLLLLPLWLGGCSSDGSGATDNPDKTSNDKSEQLEFTVNTSLTPCMGVTQQLCMWVQRGNEGGFGQFYDEIEGFEFHWGSYVNMTVKQTTLANPPADASSVSYSLVSIDSQFEDPLGTQYHYGNVELFAHTVSEEDGQYRFLGHPFACGADADCDTLVKMAGSGGLVELNFSYLGDGKIQLDGWQ